MANIFGKSARDYKYYTDFEKTHGRQALENEIRRSGHDFNAYQKVGGGAGRFTDRKRSMSARFGDAWQPGQSIEFITNNLQAIQAEIEEIMYGEFRLNDYFPFNNNIPEGAQTYSYRITNAQGQGRFIENYGTDAPVAGVTLQNVAYNLNLGGIVAQWSEDDLRSSQIAGIPLSTESIRAATEGAMQHIERVGLGTDTEQNRFEGMLNSTGIPILTNTAGTWDTLSPDQIIEQINSIAARVITQTHEIFGRNLKVDACLYLSIERYALLNTPRASFSDSTIFEFIQDSNMWTKYTGRKLLIKAVQELSSAGVGGVQRAIWGYPTEDRVWEMAMPISPRVLHVNRENFYYTAPMEYKISGLNVKRGVGCLYFDAI